MRAHLYVESEEKKNKNLQTSKLIENEIRFVIAREWGGKWGRNWIQVIKRYKIPVLG